MTLLLDGKAAAEALRLKNLTLFPKHDAQLAILIVGDDPRSKSYVNNKLKTADKWGIKVKHVHLPRTATYADIEREIRALNEDPKINGMIFQLPPDLEKPFAPAQTHALLEMILPTKDADGLVGANLGALAAVGENGMNPIPATPLGVLRLMEHFQIPLEGQDICILGKSRLVGMPLGILLAHRGATVTLCHRHTKDSAAKAKRSDILVAATGAIALVDESYTHAKQIVVDVGIVATPNGLRGDVAHEVYEKVAAYSPVPGGVGPMTVAALMENVLRLWKNNHT